MGQQSVSSRLSQLALETLNKSVIKCSVRSVIAENTTRFYDSVSPRVGGKKEFQLHLKNKKVYLVDKIAQKILWSKGIACVPSNRKQLPCRGNKKLLGRASA